MPWLSGCRDSASPDNLPPPQGLVVSEPVAAPAGSLAYVSLVPGTVLEGATATVRNLTSGFTVTTLVLGSGFDPVSVRAQIGDTLELVVRDSSAVLMLDARAAVPAARPPVVVRTDPPPRKRDVPLNAVIAIVFSEPVDPGTLGPDGVRLLRAGQPISGRVSVSQDGLRADFVPDALLAPETDYALEVTTEVADLSGDRLANMVEVPFTTAKSPASIASVTVIPDTAAVEIGGGLRLTALATDTDGTAITGGLVAWSSSNRAVVVVDVTGNVTGVGVGSAIVTATVSGTSGSASISVVPLAFTSASAGGSHTCGLTVRGSVFCWGDNDSGQLGTGDYKASTAPRGTVGGLTFLAVDAGNGHTCGIADGGHGYCWGIARNHGRVDPIPVPDPVPGFVTFTSLGAGDLHSCGLSPSGTTYCWGQYVLGAASYVNTWLKDDIGDPSPMSAGFPTFTSVTTGAEYGCGLAGDGKAFCWGSQNQFGELGNGSTQPSITMVQDSVVYEAAPVAGGQRFVSISAGRNHTCGVTTGSEAYCWGANSFGELGIGFMNFDSLTPVPVNGGLVFSLISAGDHHTCGITAMGDAYCWGDNSSGQLGDGSTTGSALPVPVSGNLTFTAVTAGGAHTCGVATDGVVYCWGDNRFGQLGDGSSRPSSVPVRVAGQ